jgi:hypothetical protein
MTNLRIKIIDTHHNNEIVETEDLTSTWAESLIQECEDLLEELKDKMYNEED